MVPLLTFTICSSSSIELCSCACTRLTSARSVAEGSANALAARLQSASSAAGMTKARTDRMAEFHL
jgi:hypothetical protein